MAGERMERTPKNGGKEELRRQQQELGFINFSYSPKKLYQSILNKH